MFGNFSNFLSLSIFENAFSLNGLLLILTLVVLEALLGVDNALVLGAKVKPLPENQRNKALMYGIWGAYLFRFIMIGLGTFLIKFMWIKAFGAVYLLYMAIHGLLSKTEDLEEPNAPVSSKNFWLTVLTVEALDIVFSIDSVLAALALSDEVWVLMLGSMLGILAMRCVAKQFVKLLIKVPELNKTAFILIAMIGVRLGLTLFNIKIPDVVLFISMAIAFGGTFVVNKINKGKQITV